MLIKKEIIGKEVVDTYGNLVGKVEDVEIDFETQTLVGFMVGKGGIFGRSNGGTLIPYGIIKVIGDMVLLTKEIH